MTEFDDLMDPEFLLTNVYMNSYLNDLNHNTTEVLDIPLEMDSQMFPQREYFLGTASDKLAELENRTSTRLGKELIRVKVDKNIKSNRKNSSRSRTGCDNCKKLKIKCDETKPTCEYCVNTGKSCSYMTAITSSMVKKPSYKSINQLIKLLDKNTNSIDLLSHYEIKSTHNQLLISVFELKLLKLFKTCMIPITNFVNGPLYDMTTVQIPNIFSQSSMVRNAVFLLSCLNLWPISNGGKLKLDIFNADFKLRQPKFSVDPHMKTIFDKRCKFLEPSKYGPYTNSLYDLTCKYFYQVIGEINELISTDIDRLSGTEQISSLRARELMISGFLVMIYLSLHPHKLVPLVQFDSEFVAGTTVDTMIDLNTDILTIANNVRCLTEIAALSVRNSKFSLLLMFNLNEPIKLLPLSAHLQHELEVLAPFISQNQYDLLFRVVKIFSLCIDKAHLFNTLMPILKFIIFCPQLFIALVKQKHFFSLRILFIHSMILQHLRLCVFVDNNIWFDYINWYAKYNLQEFGGWKHCFDQLLYDTLLMDLKFDNPQEFLEIDFTTIDIKQQTSLRSKFI